MVILAIETSCDETSVAILKTQGKSAKLLSHLVASQIKLHARTGGVVPEVAARAHIEKIIPLVSRALKGAKIEIGNLDAIAVTAGPGLQSSLMIGVDTAKALGLALNIPLVAVNHIEAHIFSPFIKPRIFSLPPARSIFPAVSLVVSGGHTELFLVRDWLKYKKLGATLDDAAGECFDKTAKLLGLPYPGGPELSKLAVRGRPVIDFPRPLMNSKDFNFSFSGLKTAVLYYLRDHDIPSPLAGEGKGEGVVVRKKKISKADVAASVQQAITDVLVGKTVRAAKQYRAKTILLGGGVAANQALRAKLKACLGGRRAESQKLKIKFLTARPEFCTDNAGMIAFIGGLRARKKHFTPLDKVRANANWEL